MDGESGRKRQVFIFSFVSLFRNPFVIKHNSDDNKKRTRIKLKDSSKSVIFWALVSWISLNCFKTILFEFVNLFYFSDSEEMNFSPTFVLQLQSIWKTVWMMSFVSLDLSFSLSFSLSLDVGVFREIWVFVVATFKSRSIFTTSVSSEAPLLSSSVKQRRFLCTFHLPVLFVSFTFFFILADRLLLFQLLLIMSLSLSSVNCVSRCSSLAGHKEGGEREKRDARERERETTSSLSMRLSANARRVASLTSLTRFASQWMCLLIFFSLSLSNVFFVPTTSSSPREEHLLCLAVEETWVCFSILFFFFFISLSHHQSPLLNSVRWSTVSRKVTCLESVEWIHRYNCRQTSKKV